MKRSTLRFLFSVFIGLTFLICQGALSLVIAGVGQGGCDTYDQYTMLGQARTGIMVNNQGAGLSQWGTFPGAGNNVDIYWGEPGNWPSTYAEEFGTKEFAGQTYVWQYAFRNDRGNGVRYALRATKAILVTKDGAQQIVNAEPGGIEGLPYALYRVCADPYTIKVWGNIMDTDGTSLLRRFYWEANYKLEMVTNPYWQGEGSKTRLAMRQSERWWDSHNTWAFGSGEMETECPPCNELHNCLENCEKNSQNEEQNRTCTEACHNQDQGRCSAAACWPNPETGKYGRAVTNAKDVGFGWTYEDWEKGIQMGLQGTTPWADAGGGGTNEIVVGQLINDQGRPAVPLKIKANPRPRATIGGETAQFVLKIIGTNSPVRPTANAFAQTSCANATPTQGNLFCLRESELPTAGADGYINLGNFIFNPGVSGTRYLWVIIHNDVNHSAAQYWSGIASNSAWSAPVRTGSIQVIEDGGSSSTTNGVIIGAVSQNSRGLYQVPLKVKAVPRPQATINGQTAHYVLKIIGSNNPTPPDLNAFASTNCTNITPTQGKLYCLAQSQLPQGNSEGEIDLGMYTFNAGVSGTRYLHAIFHNDASQKGRGYWSAALSSPAIQLGGASTQVNNTVIAGAVSQNSQGLYQVPLKGKVIPRPQATINGQTAQYVLKIIWSNNPAPPDLSAFASTNCTNITPTQGKLYCLTQAQLPQANPQGEIDLGMYNFNAGVSGTRYLHAIFHNDARSSGRGYWSAAVSSSGIILGVPAPPVSNGLIVGGVTQNGQRLYQVGLKVKGVPRPKASVTGEAPANYVLKVIGSDSPSAPDLSTFASQNCSNTTPTMGKLYCLKENELPQGDANGVINLGNYAFNAGANGTKYLHAIFHNDASQGGRGYWSAAVSSSGIILGVPAPPVSNGLIVGGVTQNGQRLYQVGLKVKGVPRPKASVTGEAPANYVLKVIGSDSPSAPDLSTFASQNCSNTTPTMGKLYCLKENELPQGDGNGVINLGNYAFNAGASGTKYLHAIVHNDAGSSGRGYWSAAVSSGAIQLSALMQTTLQQKAGGGNSTNLPPSILPPAPTVAVSPTTLKTSGTQGTRAGTGQNTNTPVASSSGRPGVSNSITSSSSFHDHRDFSVNLVVQASPQPRATINGRTENYVVKIIGSAQRNPSDLNTLPTMPCSSRTQSGENMYCLTSDMLQGSHTYTFKAGTHYLYAIFRNDESQASRNYWSTAVGWYLPADPNDDPVSNSITSLTSWKDDRDFSVNLVVQASPQPRATINGRTENYVVKIIGSAQRNPSDLDRLPTMNCGSKTTWENTVYCLTERDMLQGSHAGTYTFKAGTHYLYAIFRNDESQASRNYWSTAVGWYLPAPP